MTINRHNLVKLSLLGVGLLVIFLYSSGFRERNEPSVKSAISPDGHFHQVIFYDDWRFFQAVSSASEKKNIQSTEIKGGIIPHHLLASFMIADFFERLRIQKPDTIILIGPNHQEAGDYKALTSKYKWQTPFGLVEAESEMIHQLINRNIVRVDEEVLPREHSVAGIMPFIAYYLPKTKVIPIIVSGTMTLSDTKQLAKSLADFMTQNTVIISSVDFSHYESSSIANHNDEITLGLIKEFDHEKFFRLGNEYLDSPPSIVALLMIMERLNTKQVTVLHQTNSSQLLENQQGERTTSYFSIIFQ